MSRYDSRTTLFSPSGRIFQIEYALKAIEKASSSTAFLATDGIVLLCERRDQVKLLKAQKGEKLYQVDDHIYTSIAGLSSDARILLQEARKLAQEYRVKFNEPIPLERLAEEIADIKQSYTQHGGLRPFGAAFVLFGYDSYLGYQIYQTDPSGNYAAWKSISIGKNRTAIDPLIKSDYGEDMNVDECIKLALGITLKTADASALSPERIELGIFKNVDGKCEFKLLTDEEMKALCAEFLENNNKE